MISSRYASHPTNPSHVLTPSQQHLLVTDDGHACLANVGHASLIREKGDSKFATASVSLEAGHNRYVPPEYFTDDFASKHATKKGDIYSMGMTIYEVNHLPPRPYLCSTLQGPHRQETVPKLQLHFGRDADYQWHEARQAKFHHLPRVHRGTVGVDHRLLATRSRRAAHS